MLTLRPYHRTDAHTLEVREIDKMECEVVHGTQEWRDILIRSILRADRKYSFEARGNLVGIGGLKYLKSGVAEVWLVGNDLLTAYPITLHKLLRQLEESLPNLVNIVTCTLWSGNIVHLTWLGRLGFTVETFDPNREIVLLTKDVRKR